MTGKISKDSNKVHLIGAEDLQVSALRPSLSTATAALEETVDELPADATLMVNAQHNMRFRFSRGGQVVWEHTVDAEAGVLVSLISMRLQMEVGLRLCIQFKQKVVPQLV